MTQYQRYHISAASILILLLLSTILISPAAASIYAANGTELNASQLTDLVRTDPSLVSGGLPSGLVVFFWNLHCGACHDTIEFLDAFAPEHPEMRLEMYDLFNSSENRTIYNSFKERYNRKFLSTPSIVVGNLTLEGTSDIKSHLGEMLALQQEYATPAGALPEGSGILPGVTGSGQSSGDIPLLLIIGAGLLDGLNPCAFAVLVLLLVYLMAQKSRKAMVAAGLVYSAAVFIFYYLSGVGIFSVIQTAGVSAAFSVAAGCIALIAGLVMIKDALLPGERPTLGISPSHSGIINRVMKKASLPAAFVLGILVGMFELPCTGGIYLSIISMISLKANLSQALGYLFVYNIAFIIPLLVIIGLVTFGLPPERVNEFRLEQRRLLRGIIGLVLIGFAVFILYEVLL